MARELPAGVHEGIVPPDDEDSTSMDAPRWILQSALAALSAGQIAETVEQFGERFKFNDQALALEFTDKLRLTAFFQKPVSCSQIPRWKWFASWRVEDAMPLPNGCSPRRKQFRTARCTIGFRFPCMVHRSQAWSTEKFVNWSDYYDQYSSWRMALAVIFHGVDRVLNVVFQNCESIRAFSALPRSA